MNFLEAYEVWSGGDEAPEIYHKWAGLSALSSLVSRKVWCEQGIDVVMANLYVLLVGPAGNGKSTAMKVSRALVRKFGEFCPTPPKAQTYQSLVQDLGDDKQPYMKKFVKDGEDFVYSHASMFCNEFATLLKTDPIGWITFLTDIYDDDSYEYKIKNPPVGGKKLDHISNPFVVLLGCMTPELTAQNLQEGIISTGFTRRCVFVYAIRSKKRIPRREKTPEQFDALDWCIQWANILVRTSGKFEWEEEAIVYFDKWYGKNKDYIDTVADSFMASWLNSKDQIVIKVAMLLALSEEVDLLLKKNHIEQAVKLVDSTERHFHKIFAAAGRNPISMISTKIQALVDQQGKPINEKMIFKSMHAHGNTNEINEALNHLKNTGEVYSFQYQHGSGVMITLLGRREVIEAFQLERLKNLGTPGE